MKRSFENQQPRIVKSRGITLRGKTLEAHLGKIEKRIEVLECMRGQAEAGNTGDASIEADLYQRLLIETQLGDSQTLKSLNQCREPKQEVHDGSGSHFTSGFRWS